MKNNLNVANIWLHKSHSWITSSRSSDQNKTAQENRCYALMRSDITLLQTSIIAILSRRIWHFINLYFNKIKHVYNLNFIICKKVPLKLIVIQPFFLSGDLKISPFYAKRTEYEMNFHESYKSLAKRRISHAVQIVQVLNSRFKVTGIGYYLQREREER